MTFLLCLQKHIYHIVFHLAEHARNWSLHSCYQPTRIYFPLRKNLPLREDGDILILISQRSPKLAFLLAHGSTPSHPLRRKDSLGIFAEQERVPWESCWWLGCNLERPLLSPEHRQLSELCSQHTRGSSWGWLSASAQQRFCAALFSSWEQARAFRSAWWDQLN